MKFMSTAGGLVTASINAQRKLISITTISYTILINNLTKHHNQLVTVLNLCHVNATATNKY